MLGFRRSCFNKVRLNFQKELLSTFWFQNLVSTEFYGSVVIHFKGLELNLNKCRHRKKYSQWRLKIIEEYIRELSFLMPDGRKDLYWIWKLAVIICPVEKIFAMYLLGLRKTFATLFCKRGVWNFEITKVNKQQQQQQNK